MHPILFKIGNITIYTYGFFVFLGAILGYLVCLSVAKREKIPQETFSNILLSVLLMAFIGAKLLYIAIDFKYFLNDPLGAIRSGFVFYGGIITGIFTLYFLAKRKSISFFKLADVISVGVPLGHALGRIGCFFYGCCYGRTTDSWVGLRFPAESAAGQASHKVIPTQLISAGALSLIFLFLLYISKRKKYDGQIFIYYLIIYGAFRFLIEFLRADPRGGVWLLSTSQIISLTTIIIAVIIWKKIKRTA